MGGCDIVDGPYPDAVDDCCCDPYMRKTLLNLLVDGRESATFKTAGRRYRNEGP